MPGFFYFVPCFPENIVVKKRLQHDVLARYGLAGVLRDVVHVPDDCVVTPAAIDAGSGLIPPGGEPIRGSVLVPKTPTGSDPKDWSHNPAVQTWKAYTLGEPAGEPVYFAYEPTNPPTPADLARSTQCGGAQISDAAGQTWRLPIARSPQGRSTLPAELVRVPAGVERRVAADYQALWDLSGRIRDWVHGLYAPDDRDLWCYDAAAQVLATNYRLGPIELNALQALGRGVLTTQTIEPILVATIDWDLPKSLVDALEKKTLKAAA